jgi:hypothetical protein
MRAPLNEGVSPRNTRFRLARMRAKIHFPPRGIAGLHINCESIAARRMISYGQYALSEKI